MAARPRRLFVFWRPRPHDRGCGVAGREPGRRRGGDCGSNRRRRNREPRRRHFRKELRPFPGRRSLRADRRRRSGMQIRRDAAPKTAMETSTARLETSASASRNGSPHFPGARPRFKQPAPMFRTGMPMIANGRPAHGVSRHRRSGTLIDATRLRGEPAQPVTGSGFRVGSRTAEPRRLPRSARGLQPSVGSNASNCANCSGSPSVLPMLRSSASFVG